MFANRIGSQRRSGMLMNFNRRIGETVEQSVGTRRRADAEEIRDELRRRIEQCLEFNGECRSCQTPVPRPAHPAADGEPNWVVDGLQHLPPGCLSVVVKIVAELRLQYELV